MEFLRRPLKRKNCNPSKAMKQLVIVIFLFVCSNVFAQNRTLPASWIGNWKGQLTWVRADTTTKIKMELRIQPSDSAGVYTWHLIYGEGNKDSRPYILKPSKGRNHWVMDELNGIMVDMFFIGDRLTCSFTVAKSTITNTYWLEKGKLIAEFYMFSTDATSTTGKGTEDSPIVKSYGLRSYQKAELRR